MLVPWIAVVAVIARHESIFAHEAQKVNAENALEAQNSRGYDPGMTATTRPITRAQCVSARNFLDWDQEKLAEMAGKSRRTIQDMEKNVEAASPATMAAVVRAFTAAGIRFLFEPGPGVQLVSDDPAP